MLVPSPLVSRMLRFGLSSSRCLRGERGVKGLPVTALMNWRWVRQALHNNASSPPSPHTPPLMVMSRVVGSLTIVPSRGSLATPPSCFAGSWRSRRPHQHSSYRMYSERRPRYDAFELLITPEIDPYNPIGSEVDTDYDEDKDSPWLVNMDFQIQDSKLSHTYDLERFSKRLDHVFECHEMDPTEYLAPYFCFVQSSGMGKTKLMYEYKRMSLQEKKVASILIVPRIKIDENKDKMFHALDLTKIASPLPLHAQNDSEKMRFFIEEEIRRIYEVLDKLLQRLVEEAKKKSAGNNFRKVALLFDDSQYLLKEEFGCDAFRFRCVRHWLREKPRTGDVRDGLTIAAVFAGTKSRVTKHLLEKNSTLRIECQPSNIYWFRDRDFFGTWDKLHRPFFQTTTMGSCLDMLKGLSGLSEYERAVYHGRPLFAHMASKGILDEHTNNILLRMLRKLHWKNDNQNGWINLLSTRVQLGRLPAVVASDLVANGYANLCTFNDITRSVHTGYLPDPVPARLAMLMMDESQLFENVLRHYKVTGADKRWWSEKLAKIFSAGIVRSEKGDFEDVVVALYMLFCGDLLRKSINARNEGTGTQPYSRFSVSLDAWLELLLLGGIIHCEPKKSIEEGNVSVGFIQVCRNPLRSYSESWKSLKDQAFMKQMFDSGIAFYTFDGCPIVDIIIPLRIKCDDVENIDGFCYVPMLVAIQWKRGIEQSHIEVACKEMKDQAMRDGLDRALCLLIVFGSEADSMPFEGNIAIKRDSTEVSDNLMTGVVAKAIRVPSEDAFGLAAAFDARIPKQSVDDLFSFHPYLKAHGSDIATNKAECFNDQLFFHSEEDRTLFVKYCEHVTKGSTEDGSLHGTKSNRTEPLPNEKGKEKGK